MLAKHIDYKMNMMNKVNNFIQDKKIVASL